MPRFHGFGRLLVCGLLGGGCLGADDPPGAEMAAPVDPDAPCADPALVVDVREGSTCFCAEPGVCELPDCAQEGRFDIPDGFCLPLTANHEYEFASGGFDVYWLERGDGAPGALHAASVSDRVAREVLDDLDAPHGLVAAGGSVAFREPSGMRFLPAHADEQGLLDLTAFPLVGTACPGTDFLYVPVIGTLGTSLVDHEEGFIRFGAHADAESASELFALGLVNGAGTPPSLLVEDDVAYAFSTTGTLSRLDFRTLELARLSVATVLGKLLTVVDDVELIGEEAEGPMPRRLLGVNLVTGRITVIASRVVSSSVLGRDLYWASKATDGSFALRRRKLKDGARSELIGRLPGKLLAPRVLAVSGGVAWWQPGQPRLYMAHGTW